MKYFLAVLALSGGLFRSAAWAKTKSAAKQPKQSHSAAVTVVPKTTAQSKPTAAKPAVKKTKAPTMPKPKTSTQTKAKAKSVKKSTPAKKATAKKTTKITTPKTPKKKTAAKTTVKKKTKTAKAPAATPTTQSGLISSLQQPISDVAGFDLNQSGADPSVDLDTASQDSNVPEIQNTNVCDPGAVQG